MDAVGEAHGMDERSIDLIKCETSILTKILSNLQGRDVMTLLMVCKALKKRITNNEAIVLDLIKRNLLSVNKSLYILPNKDLNNKKYLDLMMNNHIPILSLNLDKCFVNPSDEVLEYFIKYSKTLIVETIFSLFLFSSQDSIIVSGILQPIIRNWDFINIEWGDIRGPTRQNMYLYHIGIIASQCAKDTELFKTIMKILGVPYGNIQACHIIKGTCQNTDNELYKYGIKMLKDTAHLVGKDEYNLSMDNFSTLCAMVEEDAAEDMSEIMEIATQNGY